MVIKLLTLIILPFYFKLFNAIVQNWWANDVPYQCELRVVHFLFVESLETTHDRRIGLTDGMVHGPY